MLTFNRIQPVYAVDVVASTVYSVLSRKAHGTTTRGGPKIRRPWTLARAPVLQLQERSCCCLQLQLCSALLLEARKKAVLRLAQAPFGCWVRHCYYWKQAEDGLLPSMLQNSYPCLKQIN
ncbi:unnamed protein product [Urochloa humidicola]